MLSHIPPEVSDMAFYKQVYVYLLLMGYTVKKYLNDTKEIEGLNAHL